MSLNYGVLQGKVDIFRREDNDSSPHLQIWVVDANNEAWREPVNVLSGDQSLTLWLGMPVKRLLSLAIPPLQQ